MRFCRDGAKVKGGDIKTSKLYLNHGWGDINYKKPINKGDTT